VKIPTTLVCRICKGLLGVRPGNPLACVSVQRGGCPPPARQRPATAAKDLPPMVGPACPCGGTVPRKRGWMRWDRVACRRCGQGFECADTRPLTFLLLGLPSTARTP
jgi:hypothetical protein